MICTCGVTQQAKRPADDAATWHAEECPRSLDICCACEGQGFIVVTECGDGCCFRYDDCTSCKGTGNV